MSTTLPAERADSVRRVVLVAALGYFVDIFDLFNQKTWALPASQDLASTQFCVITSASGNRNLQVVIKFIF